MEKFSDIGVEVQTGTAVEAIERAGSGFRVRARAKGRETAIDADLVVHAAGRAPDLDALNLAATGVTVDNGRRESVITYPETMPIDACQIFYTGSGCGG